MTNLFVERQPLAAILCGFGVILDVVDLSPEAELLVKVVFEDGSSTSLGRVSLRC